MTATMAVEVAELLELGEQTEAMEQAEAAEQAEAEELAEARRLTARVSALAADLAAFMGLPGPDDPRGGVDAGRGAAQPAEEGGLDAARIDQIRELEILKSACCALQATAAAHFAASQREAQQAAGVASSRAGRGIASQIGLARRECPNKGQILLGLAQCLTREMPCTLAALARGEVNEWRAMIIARETAELSREDRAAVDRELCGPGGSAGSLGDAALERAARAIGQRLDPGLAWAKAQKAERSRRVTIRPAPDCMVTLTAFLPVVHGVGVYAALAKAADAAIAAGQQGTRGRGALMADELITRILTPATVASASPADSSSPAAPANAGSSAGSGRASGPGSPSDSGGAPASESSGGRRVVPEPVVEVQLIMTDQTLYGLDDEPAHLTGYGPIPAPLARRIAAARPSEDQPRDQPRDQLGNHISGQDDASRTLRWIRRLYQKPGSGLIGMDSRRREFPTAISRFIVARDQFCRTPWCGALIRHIDHIEPAAAGGPTSAANAQGLCEACNYAKEAAGWHQDAGGNGDVTTTTPTGHRYASSPPPVPGMPAQRAGQAIESV